MNIMWLQSPEATEQSNYSAAILETLLQQYGFHLVRPYDSPAQHADKKKLIVVTGTKHQGGLRSWLDNKLTYTPLLKKWQIEKIVLPGTFFKVETQLPQYLLVPHTHLSVKEKDRTFIQRHNFSFLTYHEKVGKHIASVCPDKSTFLYNTSVPDSFQPLGWEAALEVKEMYSDGEEYFLANGIGQMTDYSVEILKGFSIFKKWQKSSMKLLLLTDNIQELQAKIANYKYRLDVRLVNQPDTYESARIVAAAYCTVHLPKEDGDNLFAMESAQCQVPVLLKKESTMLSWLDNHAFYLDEFSTDTLGQAFITMYKAENIRTRHIEYLKAHPLTVPTTKLSESLLS